MDISYFGQILPVHISGLCIEIGIEYMSSKRRGYLYYMYLTYPSLQFGTCLYYFIGTNINLIVNISDLYCNLRIFPKIHACCTCQLYRMRKITECNLETTQPGRGPVNQLQVITLYGVIPHSSATFVYKWTLHSFGIYIHCLIPHTRTRVYMYIRKYEHFKWVNK
jgi:hypothetical protein